MLVLELNHVSKRGHWYVSCVWSTASSYRRNVIIISDWLPVFIYLTFIRVNTWCQHNIRTLIWLCNEIILCLGKSLTTIWCLMRLRPRCIWLNKLPSRTKGQMEIYGCDKTTLVLSKRIHITGGGALISTIFRPGFPWCWLASASLVTYTLLVNIFWLVKSSNEFLWSDDPINPIKVGTTTFR